MMDKFLFYVSKKLSLYLLYAAGEISIYICFGEDYMLVSRQEKEK